MMDSPNSNARSVMAIIEAEKEFKKIERTNKEELCEQNLFERFFAFKTINGRQFGGKK
jgi:predicted GIY-YIG superfamily endonuclease